MALSAKTPKQLKDLAGELESLAKQIRDFATAVEKVPMSHVLVHFNTVAGYVSQIQVWMRSSEAKLPEQVTAHKLGVPSPGEKNRERAAKRKKRTPPES